MPKKATPSFDSPSAALILLAAGASTRLGTPKQLLALHGRSVLVHACATTLSSVCRPIIVVVGAQAPRMRAEIGDLPVQVVENIAWSAGMGTSIRTGMIALQEHPNYKDLAAVVLALCDQPCLAPHIIDSLVQTHNATGKAIVAARYADTLGAPALFDATLFEELAALGGTTGAKQLFARYPDAVASVPFEEGSVDIDTPQDYARLLEN